jgi:hypothetical protein
VFLRYLIGENTVFGAYFHLLTADHFKYLADVFPKPSETGVYTSGMAV